MKKKSQSEKIESQVSEVMSLMGKRSAESRKEAWGKREFKKRMREYGKLGGRPKKTSSDLTESKKTLDRVRAGSEQLLSLDEVKAKYQAAKPGKTAAKARKGKR